MAPINFAADASSAPLANYFFIAGIESSRITDRKSNSPAAGQLFKCTIEEDGLSRLERDISSITVAGAPEGGRRRKRFSYETRKSVGSFTGIEAQITTSNRSSATIRQQEQPASPGLTDRAFDEALQMFASDRDSFLEGIRFSAGQVAQPTKPIARTKTVRVTSEESRDKKNGTGSLRRRMSNMSSLSRHPTTSKSSVRNSKRLSGYNSVIPAPQRFQTDSHMHPLKRRYEPVLLDQYPSKNSAEEIDRRGPFPDYVPMFVFPNDVHVVSADERPRSTWHGFAMTGGDNARLYGICLIVWIPLNQHTAEDLEVQCEEWRRKNMTEEQREMANSLGAKLASERAKLSRMLAELPGFTSGTEERESHEEAISAVEETIALISDALRPLRHGAASKIDGLTQSESGFWIPRAYGILGKDASLTSFWKEWLRAVVAPMLNGGVLRVPASSPRVGLWQPLERYMVNMCAEAIYPISSITQVEIAVRELRLYARKEAANEITGSRNTDLYALFRSLDIPDIIALVEYTLSESRIIFLSSHTAMLHLASAALLQLIYPLTWQGILIPVLPARLIQALEAPCPYIVGIERRYDSIVFPEDDYVIVDLDQGTIEATAPCTQLPRPQRRKLAAILALAAPHRYRYGVPLGPPKYAVEAYPYDAFSTEHASIFSSNPPASNFSHLAGLPSASFGSHAAPSNNRLPLYNAFSQIRQGSHGFGSDRPSTSSTVSSGSPVLSTLSTNFPQRTPSPMSRTESGHALQNSLREKRSGFFEQQINRKSSVHTEPLKTSNLHNIADGRKFGMSSLRKPSMHFANQSSSASISSKSADSYAPSNYAPSVYAQSTLAASTVMPNILMQPVFNTETTMWSEGHHLHWHAIEEKTTCSVCEERADDGIYRCSGCSSVLHARCAQQIPLVCPVAFHSDQVMAAFARCFASLFYTYRKFLVAPTAEQKKKGMLYGFNMDGFIRSVPGENANFTLMLRDSQAFNEFLYERQTKRADEPSIRLFDEIILAKRNRGRSSFFSKSRTTFLADTSNHLWRSAVTAAPGNRAPGVQYLVGRTPAKLDPSLMKEPRSVHSNMNRASQAKTHRKPVPSMLAPPGLRID